MVPRVSVVMPVHNAGEYLDTTIASILDQDFADFEFVIRDDGSTDDSGERLRAWAARDDRIRLFAGGQLGPAGAGNFVVAQARAPIIARMDADDVARSDRLRRQFDAMTAAPDIALLGSNSYLIDECGDPLRPTNAWRLVRGSHSAPFPHSSVMYRREIFDRVGGYRSSCEWWEDLDLFLRVAAVGRVAVLPDKLVSYRFAHTSSRLVSERGRVEQSMHRRCVCVDAYRRTGDYRLLLEKLMVESPVERLHPKALVCLSTLELWSNHRCDALAPMLQRARLKLNRSSAGALLWALWATKSPATLRLALRTALTLGNLVAARTVRAGRIYEWTPQPRHIRLKLSRQFGHEGSADAAWIAGAGSQAAS